jgi:hypothetical protein
MPASQRRCLPVAGGISDDPEAFGIGPFRSKRQRLNTKDANDNTLCDGEPNTPAYAGIGSDAGTGNAEICKW